MIASHHASSSSSEISGVTLTLTVDTDDVPSSPRNSQITKASSFSSQTLSYLKRFPFYIFFMLSTYISFYVALIEYQADNKVVNTMLLDTSHPQDVWRLYTYSLLHNDRAHMINNMVMLFMMGILLNTAHGSVRIAIIHTCGALGGAFGVGWQYRMHSERIRVIGASGTIYALLGSHIGNVIINWSELPWKWFHIFVLSYMLLADVLLYIFYYNERTSYSNHFAGLLTGTLLSPLVLYNMRVRKWERIYQAVSMSLCVAFFVASFINYMLI